MKQRALSVLQTGLQILLLAVTLNACSQSVAGTDYRLVTPPQLTETPGKIEVIEFFWYGCPHCAALEPSLREWIKKQPADVNVRHVPVAYRATLIPHQRLFYALDALGKESELRPKIFDAIHVAKNPLETPERIADFVAKQGIDRKKFLDTYHSFAVESKLRRATQLVEAYGVDGVPMIAINGKYLVSAQPNTWRVLDELVAKERALLKPNAVTAKKEKK